MLPDLNFNKLHQRQVSCQQTSSQLDPTNPTLPRQDTQLRKMEFGNSGMLNEGNSDLVRALFGTRQLIKASPDGIHIDMDRLKKGEVK
jgi:hypothetical protein